MSCITLQTRRNIVFNLQLKSLLRNIGIFMVLLGLAKKVKVVVNFEKKMNLEALNGRSLSNNFHKIYY